MTQKLSLHKDATHPLDALWWRPFFSMQKQMKQTMQEMFSDTKAPSPIPSSFWNTEEDVFTTTQNNIHRLFSEMFNNRQMLTPLFLVNNTEPYVDIIENGKNFKVNAELPGLSAKDVDVSISDSALTITGEKQENSVEEDDTYIRKESCCGSFSRTIALPEEADMDKASAVFEKSVLTVEIPKKKEVSQKGRKLKIEGAESSKKATSKAQTKPEKVEAAEEKQEEANKQPELISGGKSEPAKSSASSSQSEAASKDKKPKAA